MGKKESSGPQEKVPHKDASAMGQEVNKSGNLKIRTCLDWGLDAPDQ